MYLHIGSNVLLRTVEMIAIIDKEGSRESKKINKKFLQKIKKEGEIRDISDLESKNARSMVLVDDNRVYISPISAQTLYKRSKNNGLSEGMK